MSSGYTIHVTGISADTSEEKLSSFFSFCGTISKLAKTTPSTAEITFAKESAAKTALMLNGGTLDGSHLEVTSASTAPASAAANLPAHVDANTPIGATKDESSSAEISQEDKPVTAIIAEYLAHGYAISDQIVQQAIEVDRKQGISQRFLSYINKLDSEFGKKVSGNQDVKAHEVIAAPILQTANKAKEWDQKQGVSSRFMDYYSKALNTNAGQHVLKFYTDIEKQLEDVHQEARRIADQKKASSASVSPSGTPAEHAFTTSASASTTVPSAGAGTEKPLADVKATPIGP